VPTWSGTALRFSIQINGVYELTRALPERLQSALPTIEEIEAELQSEVGEGNDEP